MLTAAPLQPTGRFDVYTIDSFEEHSGPGADGWGLMASFDEEAEALVFAEAQAAKPQPGTGWLADRVVAICPERGQILNEQRPG